MRPISKLFSIFLIFGFCLLSLPLLSQAQELLQTPAIFISNLNLNSINKTPGGAIEGTFTVLNQEDYIVGNLFYGVDLLRVIDTKADFLDPNNLKRVDSYYNHQDLVFPPKSEKGLNFSYQLPENLSSGNYVIKVFLESSELLPLAWERYSVGEIKGSEEFVSIEQLSILNQEGQEFLAHAGVPISPNSYPTLKAEIKNHYNKDLSAVYKIRILKKYFNDDGLISEKTNDLFLKALGTEELTVNLLQIETPGIYWGEISVLKDGKQISPRYDFHWIVSGETGSIAFAKINKDSFEAGEIAKVIAVLNDRPDIHLADVPSLGEINLDARLLCKDAGQIAKKVFNLNIVPTSKNEFNLELPTDKPGKDCSLFLAMFKEGKLLDSYQLNSESYKIPSEELTKIENEITKTPSKISISNFQKLVFSLIALLIILCLIYLVSVIRKKGKPPIIPLILVALFISIFYLFSPKSAQAGACIAPGYTWTSPIANHTYQLNQRVNINVSFSITYCRNYPYDFSAEIFLDGIKKYSFQSVEGSQATSLEFFSRINQSNLTPGEHRIEIRWTQDCWRQHTGTISGVLSRVFYVASPTPSLMPSCSLSFSPGIISSGQNTFLAWSSQGDSDGIIPYSCTGNLGTGNLNGSWGSTTVTPTSDQSCAATVVNENGTSACTASVYVGQIPTIYLKSSSYNSLAGRKALISWQVLNAESCQYSASVPVNADWPEGEDAAFSASRWISKWITLPQQTGRQDISLSCSNNYGSAIQTITINVFNIKYREVAP